MENMASFCGESCVNCQERACGKCAGCKVESGAAYSGSCPVKACTERKGYISCDECGQKSYCAIRRECVRKKAEKSEKKQAKGSWTVPATANDSCIFLWRIFYIPIVVYALGLLEDLAGSFLLVTLVVVLLTAGFRFVYGKDLIPLGCIQKRFRVLGIIMLVTAVLGGVVGLVQLFAQYQLNRYGTDDLILLVLRFGPETVEKYMAYQICKLVCMTIDLVIDAVIVFVDFLTMLGIVKVLHRHKQPTLARELRIATILTLVFTLALFVLGIFVYIDRTILGALCVLAMSAGYITVLILKYIYLFRSAKFLGTVKISSDDGDEASVGANGKTDFTE